MSDPTHRLTDAQIMGMLYIVEVRLVSKASDEIIKHKLLMVGNEVADIERKSKWLFDMSEYSQFSICSIEKIRQKVHFLSTVVQQAAPAPGPIIQREEGTVSVPQAQLHIEKYDPTLYAVGVVTTMLAKDSSHALRKVGNALLAMGSEGRSHSAPKLSSDSTVTIEEVPKSSGYALPRDVSNESNRAHFVRG